MSLLKEGDSCGFAQVLVASKLGGGGFAVARMSADDRSTVWALEEVTVNSVGITRIPPTLELSPASHLSHACITCH